MNKLFNKLCKTLYWLVAIWYIGFLSASWALPSTITSYKYEYRTGTSGNYEYNYDVTGEDEYGNEVSGNVDTQDKYGSGYITNSDGEEIEVETEWYGYGRMEATDSDGNTYDLWAE